MLVGTILGRCDVVRLHQAVRDAKLHGWDGERVLALYGAMVHRRRLLALSSTRAVARAAWRADRYDFAANTAADLRGSLACADERYRSRLLFAMETAVQCALAEGGAS